MLNLEKLLQVWVVRGILPVAIVSRIHQVLELIFVSIFQKNLISVEIYLRESDTLLQIANFAIFLVDLNDGVLKR